MTALNYLLVFTCVAAISAGQILFKLAGVQAAGSFEIFSKASGFAVTGLVIYGAATLLWIYLLRTVPLSVAYPFMALSYALVPVAAYFLFAESVSPGYMLGIALIIAGVTVTALQ